RKIADKSYSPTTWQIKFNLNTVTSKKYKLRLSIAASNHSDLQIQINDLNAIKPVFEVYNLGDNSTIARRGIHDLHQLFSIDVNSYLLVLGDNRVYLKQAMFGNEFCGLLYDYLRIEAP
ncbi:Rhamnogalacturonan lyase domain III-containing protein, partial [Dioscorea alata]